MKFGVLWRGLTISRVEWTLYSINQLLDNTGPDMVHENCALGQSIVIAIEI